MKFQVDSTQAILDFFNTDWISSFDYTAGTTTTFKGSTLNKDLARNPFFHKNLHYVMDIQNYIQDFMARPRDSKLPKMTLDEITTWERNGGQCIYLSALLCELLLYDKVVSPDDIYLCQGYYKHECREDNAIGMLMGKTHIGLHAWLEIKGSIVDISIAQEDQFFDFKGQPFILGEAPEGMDLIGFKEPRETAKNYCRKIARENGSVYLDWIKMHSQSSTRRFLEMMKNK